jgi:flagellar biosynthetic protein FlhB
MQVGFLFTMEPLKMKISKLDPIQGFKRIFSLRAIVELLKSILKIIIVGLVTFSVLWFQIDEILLLTDKSLGASLSSIGNLTVKMGLYASAALLFLAFLDYLYQRYDFERNIRMSKQDIKDEYKKTEGDPLIKSKIKQKQREMAMKRMMQEVPKADVVITNPTHYAVALKYEDEKMDAPVVIAKGVDYVALKIKELAKEHDVVTVENRPLARALYSQTEIGDAIPEEFFKAVAEILAYVYRLKNKI